MNVLDNANTTLAATLAFLFMAPAMAMVASSGSKMLFSPSSSPEDENKSGTSARARVDLSVLPCIRHRRSIFPKSYLKNPPPLDNAIVQSLLDAARWGPFHGKNYAGQSHPARFIVLGKKAMIEMQELTLQYYDNHWKEVGWGSGTTGTQEDYDKWRAMTHCEITGRWGPCSHMIAIVMRRQAGPKRLPEWEELAATAAAVQNMHVQSTKFPELACYWSSWHAAARDSDEMKEFLGMEQEDKCLGMFVVAQRDPKRCSTKDRRKRDPSIMRVEWRE